MPIFDPAINRHRVVKNNHRYLKQEYRTHFRQLQESKLFRRNQLPTLCHFPGDKDSSADKAISYTLKLTMTTRSTEILLQDMYLEKYWDIYKKRCVQICTGYSLQQFIMGKKSQKFPIYNFINRAVK